MGRRRSKPPPAPQSAAWENYKPTDSLYWFHGGPWVHPDKIEPARGYLAEHIRPHEKPLTRLKSVGKLLEDARFDLAKSLEGYVNLHEHGYKALPWPWMVERIEKGECDPSAPNHVHYQFCQCYGNIARLRAQIALMETIISGLEPATAPLFHWNRGG